MAKVINPSLPYSGYLANQFMIGSRIEIMGFIPKDADKFVVNLKSGSGDILLHLNPRVYDEEVVLNSSIGGSWGKEQTPDDCPFKECNQFTLLIVPEQGQFRLIVNGQFLANFPHRANFMDVRVLEINGDVQIASITEYGAQGGFDTGAGAFPAGAQAAYGGGNDSFPGGGNSSFPAAGGNSSFPGGGFAQY